MTMFLSRLIDPPRLHRTLLAVGLTAGLLGSCGGGSSSGSSGAFQLVSISVSSGFTWKLNRPIVFTFSHPIDFQTINNNSLSIRRVVQTQPEILGETALGTFAKISDMAVEWRPSCPTDDELSNGGLKLASKYKLHVLGNQGGSGIAVTSDDGKVLAQSQTRFFFTPALDAAQNAKFEDFLPNEGPGPGFELIDLTGDGIPDVAEHLTYVEKGGSASNKERFTELNVGGDGILDEVQDLNLFSDQDSRVAVVVELNQPVDPTSTNITSDRLRLEFQPLGSATAWQAVPARLELVKNCSKSGATLRLEPFGILPQGSQIRVVISAEFRDLAGNGNSQDQNADFVFTTRQFEDPVFSPQSTTDLADEVLETFVLSGTDFGTLEDADAPFAVPQAKWGDDRLEASFEFDGTGGPSGTFDLRVLTNTTLTLDTTFSLVTGGENFQTNTTQAVVNGVLNVRNLRIEAGGVLQATGPNPLVILATGTVEVFGRLDVNGGPAKDVATLDTGHLIEKGAAGVAGGGDGGDANPVTDGSSPKGTNGAGAFNVGNLGGRGGESGFNGQVANKNNRRPGGGGGGTFAAGVPNSDTVPVVDTLTSHFRQKVTDTVPNPDVLVCSPGWGFKATRGRDGNPNAKGATTGQAPAKGGEPGPSPFFDANPDNDFFGTMLVESGGQSTIQIGELKSARAGSGGGGGGNAITAAVFPEPNWASDSDEKGGGGGGGAGQIQILALKDVVFGPVGAIEARGGRGASGENTIYLDHVGGSGGGGSGGHVIIQTPAFIDFTLCTVEATSFGLAGTTVPVGSVPTILPRPISAFGGRGAEAGSASVDVNGTFEGQGAGGDGGPGLIQLHVLSSDRILLPATIDPNQLNYVTEPAPVVLVPTFGGVSMARSRWIALGGADLNPDAPATPDLVRFRFDGTVPPGSVLVTAATGVDPLTDTFTSTAHGLAAGEVVHVQSDDTLPGGILGGTDYFVLLGTADTFQVSLTNGGAAVDVTTTGAGTLRFFDPEEGLIEATAGTVQRLAPILTGAFTPGSISGTTVEIDASDLQGTEDDIYARNPNLLRHFLVRIDGNDFEVLSASNAASDEGGAGSFQLTLGLDATVPLAALNYQVIPRYFRVVTSEEQDSLPEGASIKIEFQGTAEDASGNPVEAEETSFLVPWTTDIELFNQILTEQVKFFRFRVTFDIGSELSGDTPTPALEFLRIPFVF